MTSAPLVVYPLVRLGQRVRRTTRRSQEALEQLSHISAEAFTGHRIVKAFGTEAHEAAKFSRAGYQPVPHQHEGDGGAVEPAAADGAARRHRHGRRARGTAAARSRAAQLTTGRVHLVHRARCS